MSDNNSIYFYQVRRHHPSCGIPRTVIPTLIPTATLNVLPSSNTRIDDKSKDRTNNKNNGQGAGQATISSRTPSLDVEVEGNGERPIERDSQSRLHVVAEAAVVTKQPGSERSNNEENVEEKLPESGLQVEVEVESTVR